jgi:hypothetical protein
MVMLKNPVEMIRYENTQLSLSSIIQKGMTISDLQKNGIGASMIVTLLDGLLTRLQQSFNVSNGLTPVQIEELANNLYLRFPHECLSDFILCFKWAKEGRFGTTYNRIDMQVVSAWMEKYLELKAYEREILQQDNETETQETKPTNPEYEEARLQWYAEKLQLRNELDKLSEGRIASNFHNSISIAEYQNWKADYFAKKRRESNQETDSNGPGSPEA